MLGFKNREQGHTAGTIVAIFKDSKEAVTDSIELSEIVWSTKSDDADIQMLQGISNVLSALRRIVKESQPEVPCNTFLLKQKL